MAKCFFPECATDSGLAARPLVRRWAAFILALLLVLSKKLSFFSCYDLSSSSCSSAVILWVEEKAMLTPKSGRKSQRSSTRRYEVHTALQMYQLTRSHSNARSAGTVET